jgi:hypothetical protein
MEIDNQKYWGLDVSKIESLDDVKLILDAMDLYLSDQIPGFDKVKHLFTTDATPKIIASIQQQQQEQQQVIAPEPSVGFN